MFHSVLGYSTEKSCARHVFRDGEMKNKTKKLIVVAVLILFVGVVMTSCCKSKLTVSISPDELTLGVGEEDYFLSGIVHESSTMIIDAHMDSWSSSNPNVATVADFGYVKAVSQGECEITATYKGESAICKLTVIEGMTNNPHSIIRVKSCLNHCSGGDFVDLPETACTGDQVCFSITCAEDSKLASVVVNKADDADQTIPLEEQAGQHYCFVMPSFRIIVSATFVPNTGE